MSQTSELLELPEPLKCFETVVDGSCLGIGGRSVFLKMQVVPSLMLYENRDPHQSCPVERAGDNRKRERKRRRTRDTPFPPFTCALYSESAEALTGGTP